MVVQHNLSAMNANRMYGITYKKQAKVTEKLSSGYKINRAADDAAGLAISEKLRRQVRGLTQASANCQEAIGLVQTADGALNEMHDILQRVNELAVKAANDTNTTVDRGYIQQEVGQLRTEINRISNNTTFNEIYLFKRDPVVKINADDYSNVPLDESKNIGGTNYGNTKEMDFSNVTDANKDFLNGKTFTVNCSAGCNQVFTFSFIDSGGGADTSTSALTTGPSATRPNISVTVDLSSVHSGADIAQKIYDLAHAREAGVQAADASYNPFPSGTIIGHANALAVNGASLSFVGQGGGSARIKADQLAINEETLNIQAGSESGQYIPLKLFTINAGTLGIGDLDVRTQAGAAEAIQSVKNGLEGVSNYRSYYGALQNRLEHTINNLNNVVENTQAAESQIRDTDMATSMVEYSNQNILAQAGQSMLAQANQSKQGVLSLLQ